MAAGPLSKNIKLSELILDRFNPRLGINSDLSEEEIIEQMLRDENLIGLAKHIATHGLNPLEHFAVTQTGSKFVVLEGNRRVCALKLIDEPELAFSMEERFQEFNEIAKKQSLTFDILPCVLFPDRKSFSKWQRALHSDSEAGRKKWGAYEKAAYDENSPNRLAYLILQYAEAEDLLGKDSKKSYDITTMTRYLKTLESSGVFGNVEGKTELWYSLSKNNFRKLVKWFLADLIGDNLTSRSNKKDRLIYVKELYKRIFGKEPPKEPKKVEKPKHKFTPTPTPKRRSRASTSKFLIKKNWKGFDHKTSEERNEPIWAAFDEFRKLEYAKYKTSAAFLMRALLEASIRRLLKLGRAESRKKHLADLYHEAEDKLNELEGKGFVSELKKAADQPTHLLHPDQYNEYVHLWKIPTDDELKTIWSRMEKIFEKLLEHGK